jgi:Flp pilus assembly protein TadD
VRYVLEGSVRRSGNRIRVTAQLIYAQDDAHLWVEPYDRIKLCISDKGQYDEAVADARRAVKLASCSADVVDLAGFVLAPSGYPEEAVAKISVEPGL